MLRAEIEQLSENLLSGGNNPGNGS